MELAQEKGTSSWLTTRPLKEHNFALHKRALYTMPLPSDMVGLSRMFPLIVPVEPPFLSNTNFLARVVVLQY